MLNLTGNKLVRITMYIATAVFLVAPIQQTVAQGQNAEFQCQHSTGDAISWTLNGTSYLGLHLDGVSTNSTPLPGGVLGTLTIVAYPEYNQTGIRCVATFFDGSPIEQSDPVMLTIQGLSLTVMYKH